jgi:hypothetical protein
MALNITLDDSIYYYSWLDGDGGYDLDQHQSFNHSVINYPQLYFWNNDTFFENFSMNPFLQDPDMTAEYIFNISGTKSVDLYDGAVTYGDSDATGVYYDSGRRQSDDLVRIGVQMDNSAALYESGLIFNDAYDHNEFVNISKTRIAGGNNQPLFGSKFGMPSWFYQHASGESLIRFFNPASTDFGYPNQHITVNILAAEPVTASPTPSPTAPTASPTAPTASPTAAPTDGCGCGCGCGCGTEEPDTFNAAYTTVPSPLWAAGSMLLWSLL